MYEGYHYIFKYNFMDIEIHENDLFENQIWTILGPDFEILYNCTHTICKTFTHPTSLLT